MSEPLRLMACLAHPDDESLGLGGTLLRYADEGVETFLVTATFGDRGRYKGIRQDDPRHPGVAALAKIREEELHAAARALGVKEVVTLGYPDKLLDDADPLEVASRIAAAMRRLRPHVVLTFPPDGAYGHPDHIAISQLTTAAIVAAAAAGADGAPPHVVSKLYYMAWTTQSLDAYRASAGSPMMEVDGVKREAPGWPAWLVSARLETLRYWPRVWKAVCCHESQRGSWEGLQKLTEHERDLIWGTDTYYRAFSLVNGGRRTETDLFEGIRQP